MDHLSRKNENKLLKSYKADADKYKSARGMPAGKEREDAYRDISLNRSRADKGD